MRGYFVIIMFAVAVIAAGCGSGSEDSGPAGGGQPTESPSPYTFSVSGTRITTKTVGACGDLVSDTGGASGYTQQVTCNGEAHTLVFSNIQYSCGSVVSFNVTIDGTAASWTNSNPPTCTTPQVSPPVPPEDEDPPTEDPPAESEHSLGVSGTQITISDLGACGDWESDTLGASDYEEEVACDDETHTLVFSNIEYEGMEITSFNVTIDGVDYFYP